MKEKFPIDRANRLINSGSVILLTCQLEDKVNIISLSWQMPVSRSPMMVAVAVGKDRFSHSQITGSGEFGINVPTWNLIEQVDYCGTRSGIDYDKFKECNFTPFPGEKIKVPLIQECFANLECRVVHKYEAGDHNIFVAEVLEAWVNKGALKGGVLDVPKIKTIQHLGGDYYAWLTR